jgi:Zn-dependent M28 family amino/carboxypeptidase
MRRFVDLRLRPAFRGGCDTDLGCGKSYVQVFPFQKTVGQNVGAIIDGTDSTLRAEYFVIGAHFDGQSLDHVSDPQRGFVMRPGADDNASGTAGVLEMARRFVKRPIRRSIVVVGFDAEEEGLCGSRAFVAAPPVAESTITLMLNLDMIGHIHGNRIFVEGAGERATSRLSINRAAATVGLRPDFIPDRELSDHVSFRDRSVDVVSLSTGDNPDYHTTNDVASHIDMDGVNRVIDFAEAIIRDWDTGSRSKADAPTPGIRSSNPERRPESLSCGA